MSLFQTCPPENIFYIILHWFEHIRGIIYMYVERETERESVEEKGGEREEV
jgi:hypothetical protein